MIHVRMYAMVFCCLFFAVAFAHQDLELDESDKLTHTLMLPSLAAHLDILGVAHPLLCAYCAGMVNEFKDHYLSYRDAGIFGGEKFGVGDLIANTFSLGMYALRGYPHRKMWIIPQGFFSERRLLWMVPAGIVFTNMTYNKVAHGAFFPHSNVGFVSQSVRPPSMLKTHNSQNSIAVAIATMSLLHEKYALADRIGISVLAVMGYEVCNALFDDQDLWYFGSPRRYRGFSNQDVLLGLAAVGATAAYEWLAYDAIPTVFSTRIDTQGNVMLSATLSW